MLLNYGKKAALNAKLFECYGQTPFGVAHRFPMQELRDSGWFAFSLSEYQYGSNTPPIYFSLTFPPLSCSERSNQRDRIEFDISCVTYLFLRRLLWGRTHTLMYRTKIPSGRSVIGGPHKTHYEDSSECSLMHLAHLTIPLDGPKAKLCKARVQLFKVTKCTFNCIKHIILPGPGGMSMHLVVRDIITRRIPGTGKLPPHQSYRQPPLKAGTELHEVYFRSIAQRRLTKSQLTKRDSVTFLWRFKQPHMYTRCL